MQRPLRHGPSAFARPRLGALLGASVLVLLPLVLVVAGRSDGRAQAPTAQAPTPFSLRDWMDADELALAAHAGNGGARAQAAVQAALTDPTGRAPQDVASVWAAIRAAPYVTAPALLLEPLTRLARGRDPDLAPAAARRLLQIAQELSLETAPLDVSNEELARARAVLDAIAQNTLARADVRSCAAQASELLRPLSVRVAP